MYRVNTVIGAVRRSDGLWRNICPIAVYTGHCKGMGCVLLAWLTRAHRWRQWHCERTNRRHKKSDPKVAFSISFLYREIYSARAFSTQDCIQTMFGHMRSTAFSSFLLLVQNSVNSSFVASRFSSRKF